MLEDYDLAYMPLKNGSYYISKNKFGASHRTFKEEKFKELLDKSINPLNLSPRFVFDEEKLVFEL